MTETMDETLPLRIWALQVGEFARRVFAACCLGLAEAIDATWPQQPSETMRNRHAQFRKTMPHDTKERS